MDGGRQRRQAGNSHACSGAAFRATFRYPFQTAMTLLKPSQTVLWPRQATSKSAVTKRVVQAQVRIDCLSLCKVRVSFVGLPRGFQEKQTFFHF